MHYIMYAAFQYLLDRMACSTPLFSISLSSTVTAVNGINAIVKLNLHFEPNLANAEQCKLFTNVVGCQYFKCSVWA